MRGYHQTEPEGFEIEELPHPPSYSYSPNSDQLRHYPVPPSPHAYGQSQPSPPQQFQQQFSGNGAVPSSPSHGGGERSRPPAAAVGAVGAHPQQYGGYPAAPYGQGSPYADLPSPTRSRPPPHPTSYDYSRSSWGSSFNTLPVPQSPNDSRSATPVPISGSITPIDRFPPNRQYGPFDSPFDSRPSSLIHQSNLSLANLLPADRSHHPAKEGLEGYSIEALHSRDDAEIWKGWKRQLFKLVPILVLANTALYLLYLGVRMACLISAQNERKTAYPQAWVFIAVEIAVAIPSMAHNLWTMMAIKKRKRPQLRLVGDDVPTVDVFVTCCGEDDALVLDTVRAACEVDYPRDRFRVIVLDDGKSAELEAGTNALAALYPHLYYMSREKIPGKPHHFKAGNLNYGLEQIHLLPGGAAQFMAALDADMIPEPMWLRAILPHLLRDPKMALACPPQLFYNTPPSDPLAQSLDFFVHVIEPIKDALGVAWCTGSGYVVRIEALEEIGNFPLGSLAEDVATSSLMLGRGWKTAYVHEPLQFGTVPDDFGSHLKQRTRWAIGTVDTSFKLNFCLWGDKVKHMSFAQRFSGALYALLSVYTVLLTISMFAIPIILVMEKPLVAYATNEQLRWLIRVCFISTISNRLCEFALFIPAGYHTGQRGSRYQLWMSPYIALCIIRSFVLPKWLGGQTQAFKPTGSLASALNERDPELKKNMFRRLWAMLFNYMGFFHFGFVYLTLTAVVITSYKCFYIQNNVRELLICLITHAFWPPLTFLFICMSLWTPISYAIDPPQMPQREDLLDRDPKTQVAHPTPQSKKIAFGQQAAWFEIEYTLSTLYSCLIFVASFLF